MINFFNPEKLRRYRCLGMWGGAIAVWGCEGAIAFWGCGRAITKHDLKIIC
ncbi:MAG: hypothetical protein ACKO2Z_18980 [Sphaerospermopsis kisseleviana]